MAFQKRIISLRKIITYHRKAISSTLKNTISSEVIVVRVDANTVHMVTTRKQVVSERINKLPNPDISPCIAP